MNVQIQPITVGWLVALAVAMIVVVLLVLAQVDLRIGLLILGVALSRLM